jgi:cytochrome c
MKKTLLLSVLTAGLLSVLSCKKEQPEESVAPETATTEATIEATTETTNEVQKPEDLGLTLFNGKGACIACHKTAEKLVGPSLQDIAKIYKEKNGDMVTFLKGEGKPIVDPSQYELMKASFAITKTFSDEELKALEAYVYSTLK